MIEELLTPYLPEIYDFASKNMLSDEEAWLQFRTKSYDLIVESEKKLDPDQGVSFYFAPYTPFRSLIGMNERNPFINLRYVATLLEQKETKPID